MADKLRLSPTSVRRSGVAKNPSPKKGKKPKPNRRASSSPDKSSDVAYLTAEHVDKLLEHYERNFGTQYHIMIHEKVSERVHLDTYIYAPTAERPFITAATVGMSALPVIGLEEEKQADGDSHHDGDPHNPADRVELIMYLDQNWDFDSNIGLMPIVMQNFIARYPHVSHTDFWQSLSIEYPTDFVIEGSLLTDAYIATPVFENLGGNLEDFIHVNFPDGTACHIYWHTPITMAECYLKRTEGAKELELLLIENDCCVLDIDRQCLVSKENRAQRRAREKAQRLRAKRRPSKSVYDLECTDPDHAHNE